MYKFIPQYEPLIKKSYIKAVSNQMKTGWIGTSIATENFEAKLKELHSVKHVISTTSGTMALFLGIAAMRLPKNKKILFPSYTFLAGANVIKFLDYEIEFIDIHRHTLCINPNLLEERLSKSNDVSAVVFVAHNAYTGHILDAKRICDRYDVKLIEDTAQCMGDPNIGSEGEFGILSFSVPKLVTTGQGGAILTNNDELAETIKQYRDHGDNWRRDKLHKFVGLNLKFNDISSALGISQLNILDELILTREAIFDRYRRNDIGLLDLGQRSNWMPIYPTKKSDQIIDKLKLNNIQAVKYYKPINHNPSFYSTTKYPDAEYVYDNYVYLPSSLTLKNKDIDRICKIIKGIEDE
jgi:perosamine synthetase